MPDIGLIIFDCDGVLVDSEPLAMRVLLETIAAEGVRIDPDTGFREFLGRSLSTVVESLNAAYGLNLTEDALDRMRASLFAVYRRELKPMAGLIDALAEISIPACVASSSLMERIRVSLSLTGLLDRFDPAIFSAAMVPNGKPAPDLFLHAADAMLTAPEHCLVIEDSPAGIVAAQRAGMRVFAFLGGGHIAPSGLRAEIAALHPDAMFDDMRELPALVERELARGRAGRDGDVLIGVDVGTGSARAGVFSARGTLLGRGEHIIAMHRPSAREAAHDSEDIWRAVIAAVRQAVAAAGVPATQVAAIAFDATCSLVIRDRQGAPLGVSADGTGANWDTMVWLDHRAMAEAAECTATGDPVLENLGGVMSPEMQLPKLMWLKRHVPASWDRLGLAFDLCDFLAWKATGTSARSRSALASKWGFEHGGASGWPTGFLARIGLDDLIARAGLPDVATPPGTDLGPLEAGAAAALGLTTRTRVAAGAIDAHAGALGVLGSSVSGGAALDGQLCLIAGTSNSVLALAADARPIRGVWGPYRDAILPDAWLLEAGQSATGALLDHMIRWHRAGGEPTAERHQQIAERIEQLRAVQGSGFASDLHILPDFHGNRSPLADAAALGVISGLAAETDFDSLCRLYWRTAVAIALGVRQNVETLAAKGFSPARLLLGGGHSRNRLLIRLYADATGATVVEPNAPDVMLLGAAMLAAIAAGWQLDLRASAAMMAQGGTSHVADPTMHAAYDRDYRVMLEMQKHRAALAAIR